MDPSGSPVVLFIGHVIPHPPAAGNEIRILKMIQRLTSRGFRVVSLFNSDPIDHDRKLDLEHAIGPVHFFKDDLGETAVPAGQRRIPLTFSRIAARALPDSGLYRWFFGTDKKKKIESDKLKDWFASDAMIRATRILCERYRPVAVIAEYIFTAPCFDALPAGVVKLIDTHDVFSRKKAEVSAHGIYDPLVCTGGEERSYLRKCDVVIAIQPDEAELLRSLVPAKSVITVGIDFDRVAGPDSSGVVPGTVLVVGSDNPLNEHGLKTFLEGAWPAIRKGFPGAVLRVVGKLTKHIPAGSEGVEAAGWVRDLDDEYRKAAVVINPTRAGTGLKIKTVEALCRAKAFVGTPNSVEGLDSRGDHPYIVGRDWPEFAAAVLQLLKSSELRGQLEHRAIDFARDRFAPDRVYAPLDGILTNAVHSTAS